MKQDIAERFAATAIEGITVEQARQIIGEFLTQIVRCPVCDGSGEIQFGRDVVLPVRGDYGRSESEQYFPAGTVGKCPRCGGGDEDGGGRFDPEYVAWHCVQGSDDRECCRQKGHNGHADCGWRITLPLPEAP
jgi:hypothetical protein